MQLLKVAFRVFLIAGLTLSVLLFLPSGSALEEQPWVKFADNPVLSPTPNRWDSDFVVQPRVLYDGNTYRMWYVGGKQGTIAIGYAVSLDGISWAKHATPVLTAGPQGAWDSSEVGLGSVYWNGTHFLMWYRGVSPRFVGGAIGFATSVDGISWVKYSSNPVLRPSSVDLRFLTTPNVVKTSALFNMWYAARGEGDQPLSQVQRILYATSFDGVHWEKYTGVPKVALEPNSTVDAWDSGSVYSPTVYIDGTNYGMWYSALNHTYLEPRIGFATSKDGTSWTRFSGNPVLNPGPSGSWDSVGVENPSIIIGKLGFMLFYDGIGETIAGSIGFAQPPMGFTIPEFTPSSLSLIVGVTLFVAISLVTHNNRRKD